METLDKQNAENLLSNLNVTIAGGGLMNEEDYGKYIDALLRQAKIKDDDKLDDSDEFEKDKLAMLRQKLGN